MSLLDSVVTINITKTSASTFRVGFGVPLLMVYHTVTAKRLASYGSVQSLLDDGFPLTHPAVEMATALFSQTPRPATIYVGKRLTGTTQVLQFVPKNLTPGFVYTFTVEDYLGVQTPITYTVPGSPTTTSVSLALVALITGVVDVTAAGISGGASGFSLTSTVAGNLFDVTGLPNPDDLHVFNSSADPGIAADLAAVYALNSLGWYAILLDSNSKAEITASAAWVEATRKLLIVNSSDSDCADNTITTDVMSVLKTSSYSRTATLFSASGIRSYSASAWVGKLLPNNPGKAVWFFVTLAGVPIDALKDGQITNIEAKNGNVYIQLAGQGATDQGVDAEGEWLDIIVGTDWLQSAMQTRVIGALQAASNSGSKIPYTDKGVQIMVGLVKAQLKQGESSAYQLLAPGSSVVTAPAVADVDPADKQARSLPDLDFTSEYAGAIRSTKINGTISV